ncbi:hypothetical protein [Muribaculum intestinale]|uniref:hypothetical protein n=1 Tax=Muribaculum intestinale TaxID=1796646 RepID=UPI0035272E6E
MSNSGKRRVGIFIGCVVALFVAVLVAQAHVERRYRTTASQHITLVVDSIDYRQDLTRVYGKLIGTPHTSQRIDAMTLTSGSNAHEAVDIDGVDFSRWFQWEEDGVIAVEIDFEAMAPVRDGVITINTPRGVDTMRIDRP